MSLMLNDVAMPLTVPVVAFRDSPPGRRPATTLQTYGLTPPAPVSVVVKARFAVAAGSVLVLTVTWGSTVTLPATATDSKPLSLTVTVKGGAPAVVGVPVIVQLLFSVRPSGSVPPESAHE